MMTDDSISTSALLQRLFKTSSIARFIKHYGEQMSRVPFNAYINRLCADKDTVPERVILKSGIERTYGHQLFNGTRKPSRDKVIQLALGFEMDYNEVQDLLKIARKSTLYPKIERDAVVIFALKKGLSVVEVQLTLKELDLPLLGKEDKYE
ncbi:MAG: hypothetical protein LBN43_05520 [Oscillospiraceae bacterium]|jgi:hypothetical protein|nr:hypothetical protein [Oscillospiraceae bacterium]